MFNRISLVLLIILVIIITIIFYQSHIKKKNYTFEIQEEEQSYSENSINSENPINSENTINSKNPQYSESSILLSLSKLLGLTNNIFKKLLPLNQQRTDSQRLNTQYQPYLKYPLSNNKKLTTSNNCLFKERDSCPLSSYKQCSNNYPLPDYNSFEICNCNVNNICPYKLESATEKPAIKIDCPLVHNQEKHTLILP